MKRFFAGLLLAVAVMLVVGCQSPAKTFSDVYVAYEAAPTAKELLVEYAADDDELLTAINTHLFGIEALYQALDEVDDAQSLLIFATENAAHLTDAAAHWKSLRTGLDEYALRSQRPIPDSISAYIRNVEDAWQAMHSLLNQNERIATVKHYSVLLLRIYAARQGLIL